MGNLINLLNGTVQFPAESGGWFPFIGKFAYILTSAIYSNGAISIGVSLILFSIILKLILSPLDFFTKYFTKKNSNFMQKIKPDLDAVKEQYAGEPQKLYMAQRAVYQQHGYKMGGFLLFMLLNLFVSMAVFFSVFSALRGIADHNIAATANELQSAHANAVTSIEDGGLGLDTKSDAYANIITAAYHKHDVGFLWIKNIWKQDVPWVDSGIYLAGIQYDDMNEIIERESRSYNGLLILIILAGVTSWASAWLSAKIMATKKKNEPAKAPVVAYSMRDAKTQNQNTTPSVDPVMMGKIMKIVLPAMMVFFTLSSTAALALYIITNSIMTTILTYAMTVPVNFLLKKQEKHSAQRGDTPKIDMGVINPHAKYFKTKGKQK